MFKSRLQELCQKKRWGMPDYTTIKDGPDHIPTFRASVVVSGLRFDSFASFKTSKAANSHAAMRAFLHFTSSSSPPDCSTSNVKPEIRVPKQEEENQDFNTKYANHGSKNPMEAEHSGNAKMGSMSQSMHGFHKDESGIFKNLLQELTKRECLHAPVYTTIKSAAHHPLTFFSSVEVEGSVFYGIAGSVEQAEHSAAMSAYKSLNEYYSTRKVEAKIQIPKKEEIDLGVSTQAGNAKTVAEGVGVAPSAVMNASVDANHGSAGKNGRIRNALPTQSNPPAVLPFLKSMAWVMGNKNSTPGNRVAVINLKLQDHSTTPESESEVKFQLSRALSERMLKYMSKQLPKPADEVDFINVKLQVRETTSGELKDVSFEASRDTLCKMLGSLAYIRDQLSTDAGEKKAKPLWKKQRK